MLFSLCVTYSEVLANACTSCARGSGFKWMAFHPASRGQLGSCDKTHPGSIGQNNGCGIMTGLPSADRTRL